MASYTVSILAIIACIIVVLKKLDLLGKSTRVLLVTIVTIQISMETKAALEKQS